MGARTRALIEEYCYPGTGKTYYNNTLAYTLVGGNGISKYVTNQDVTMPPPYVTPHSLTIIRRECDPLRFEGDVSQGPYRNEYRQYNPVNRSTYGYTPSITNPIPWQQLKTKAMALMNPSKPAVDLPVFLWELKDFPRMLQQLGRVLQGKTKASDVAGGYVAYSFGWAPLISDLGKLINLSKLIDDRARQLKRLEDRKGLRKKLGKHGPFTGTPSNYTITHVGMGGNLFTAVARYKEEGEYWATGKVNLMGSLPQGFDERRWLAAKAALGLNLSAASLWEATPWSWLIDYFSNVGDILDAQRGFIPVQYKDICVMAKVVCTSELTSPEPDKRVKLTGTGRLTTTYKQRSVYINPTPMLQFDTLLSWHQMGILASLSTALALRKAGR